MSTEDLMKPRYKVIADYPLSKLYFIIGDVLYFNEDDNTYRIYEKKVSMHKDTVESFPHLFRKLLWWEGRTIEELKSIRFAKVKHYVGYWRLGDIVKVEKFIYDKRDLRMGYDLEYKHFHPACYIEPATEQEYLNSINKTPTP